MGKKSGAVCNGFMLHSIYGVIWNTASEEEEIKFSWHHRVLRRGLI